MKNNGYLTAPEAAKYLNMNPITIYRRAAKDLIPHYKIGRALRFRMDELDDWMRRKYKKGA